MYNTVLQCFRILIINISNRLKQFHKKYELTFNCTNIIKVQKFKSREYKINGKYALKSIKYAKNKNYKR